MLMAMRRSRPRRSISVLTFVAAFTIAAAAAEATPNLKAAVRLTPLTADAGATITAKTTVTNRGTSGAGASVVRLYLSTDPVWSAGDIELAVRAVPFLAVDAKYVQNIPVMIPPATAMGEHYIIAKADADGDVAESRENDNTDSALLGVGPGPDLASWIFSPATACAGAVVTLTDKTKNLGNVVAPASTTYFYLSSDRKLDAGDLWLGERHLPAIAPGGFDMGSIDVTLPDNLIINKTYYVFAIADGPKLIAEINENYAEYAKLTITCIPEICGDGVDNDGDGLIDEGCVEICGDGIDNDGDGQIDEGCVEICNDGIDNDGDGLIDENCVEICGDGVDNDGDGLIDEGCVEICGDGIDNDGDGDIDEGCLTEICNDGIDNDGDGQVDEGCDPPGNPGTGTPGYWMNHAEAWPVQTISIGGIVYTKAQAIGIMQLPVSGDKTYSMFPQLVSAKLNVLIGNDGSCVGQTILDANAWMALHPVGSGVPAESAAWAIGGPLHTTLDRYNNGKMCAPHRD